MNDPIKDIESIEEIYIDHENELRKKGQSLSQKDAGYLAGIRRSLEILRSFSQSALKHREFVEEYNRIIQRARDAVEIKSKYGEGFGSNNVIESYTLCDNGIGVEVIDRAYDLRDCTTIYITWEELEMSYDDLDEKCRKNKIREDAQKKRDEIVKRKKEARQREQDDRKEFERLKKKYSD